MKKILVIAPHWIGDLVFIQPLLAILKQCYLNCHIAVLAVPYLRTLLAKIPEVDQWISSPFKSGVFSCKERLLLGLRLRQQQFTDAYLIPNSWKSALVPFLAGIPHRVGWVGECRYLLLNDIRRLDLRRFPLIYERFAALAFNKGEWFKRPLVRPHLVTSKEELGKVLHRLQLESLERIQQQGPVLAIAVGAAGGECKCWPVNHQISLARHYLQQGWQVWLLGGAHEAAKASCIQQATDGRCVNLTGQTDLGELVELMVVPKVVVAGDTGVLHLAAAVGTRVIGIYGSTAPLFSPPLTDRATILWHRDSCSPCFQRTCRFGDRHCLANILPEQVIATIDTIDKS